MVNLKKAHSLNDTQKIKGIKMGIENEIDYFRESPRKNICEICNKTVLHYEDKIIFPPGFKIRTGINKINICTDCLYEKFGPWAVLKKIGGKYNG